MAGVYDAVRRMSNSGARVMMITGDSEGTAVSIAKYAGVYNPHEIRSRILSGKEMMMMMMILAMLIIVMKMILFIPLYQRFRN
jgi:magnesium-transporting ATPase (P-type)